MQIKEQQILNKLRILKAINPSKGWMAFNKSQLLQRIEEEQSFSYSRNNLFFGISLKTVAVSCMSLVLLILSSCNIFASAEKSMPGDLLYSVKILTEEARIAFSSDKNKSLLETEFAGRRLQELCQLIDNQSNKEVVSKDEFAGVVDNFNGYMGNINKRLEKVQKEGDNSNIASAVAVKNINNKVEEYKKQIEKVNENLPEEIKESVKDNVEKVRDITETTSNESLKIMASIAATSSDEQIRQFIPEEEIILKVDTKFNKINNQFVDLGEEYKSNEVYDDIEKQLELAEDYFNEKDFVKTLEIIEDCEKKLAEMVALVEIESVN